MRAHVQSNDLLIQWRCQLFGLSDPVALIRGMDTELALEEAAAALPMIAR